MTTEINKRTVDNIYQRNVAIGLTDKFIAQLEHEDVRDALRKIRDIVWSPQERTTNLVEYDRNSTRRNQDRERIKEIVSTIPEELKHEVAEGYVRLGHLYEIAGHVARSNYFDELETRRKAFKDKHPEQVPDAPLMTPGGLHQMLFHDKHFKDQPLEQIISVMNQPVSEYVFTQHPTNTNTLASMQLQRKIAAQLEEIAHDKLQPTHAPEKWEALNETLKEYATTPVVQDENFTARGETDIVINYLSNAFQDIDRLYAVTDRGLERKFNSEYDEEAQWNLDLKQRFSSWGSAGDKDGNQHIKAENTLEAIILHKKKAAELYADAITGIDGLAEWKEKFQRARDAYDALEQEISAVRDGNDIPLTRAQFDAISDRAQAISRELGKVDDFIADIAAVNESEPDAEKKKQLLAASRKARIFGFNLGKIEYRETAEEYERVVNVLMNTSAAKAALPELSALFDELSTIDDKQERDSKRAEIVTTIMNDDDFRSKWITEIAQTFLEEADATQLRNYRDDDPAKSDATIVYHTLRRMELARDFDDMITHNVLAECQGVHNMLDTVLLQTAVTNRDGKRAMMHVVPLFEDAETMEDIPTVLEEGLTNRIYHQHLCDLQIKEATKDITQQIQIAHSDNARRAGAIASRGIIHEGHRAARAAIEQYNAAHSDSQVNLQFFEGGSMSDSYRNGVRAATSAMQDFGLGKFSKMTFQGGDLLNYFNEPSSCERLMTRALVQQMKLSSNGKGANGHHSAVEGAIVDTLEDLQKSYDVNWYEHTTNPIGKLLHALGYRQQTSAGSAGTRGNRTAIDWAKEKITGVPAKFIRTIGFSETFQHGGLHPSCLGTESLNSSLSVRLYELYDQHEDVRQQMDTDFAGYKERYKKYIPADATLFDEQGQLTAVALRYLYKTSPTFQDAIDKMSYSLINTRVETFSQAINAYQKSLKDPRKITDKAHDKRLYKAANEVMNEYQEAGWLVYKSLTGKEITPEQYEFVVTRASHNKPQDQGSCLLGEDQLSRLLGIIKNIPQLEHFSALHSKHRFLDGLEIIEKKAGLEYSRLTHNGRDTVYHGRTFVADDPMYGKSLTTTMRQEKQRGGITV